MKSQTYFTLETDDLVFKNQFGECLNMLSFVFTHRPDLRRIAKDARKKLHLPVNPYDAVFNGNPFTLHQFDQFRDWIDDVIEAGEQSLVLQHPACGTDAAS